MPALRAPSREGRALLEALVAKAGPATLDEVASKRLLGA
jgi:hypothetical protein